MESNITARSLIAVISTQTLQSIAEMLMMTLKSILMSYHTVVFKHRSEVTITARYVIAAINTQILLLKIATILIEKDKQILIDS